MKIRSLLIIVAAFSVLLFSIGTAQAVLGIPDDTVGQDIVIPFICEVGAGTLDTQWAIAEVSGLSAAGAHMYVFNYKSIFVIDDTKTWTPYDVISEGCKHYVATLSPAQQTLLTTTVTENGVSKSVYLGYVIYVNNHSPSNQFVSWVYLNDIPNGFNSGFNGYSVEGGVDRPAGFPTIAPSNLEEGGGPGAGPLTPVSASMYYPRYFFFNTNIGTFNWWILLKGGPVLGAAAPQQNLNGTICNEEEECRSIVIYVPYNLNVIDVQPIIPPVIFHTSVAPEDGVFTPLLGEVSGMGGGFAVLATQSGAAAGFGAGVSSLGWSYQRAATGLPATNWDVIHPWHALRP